MSILEKIKLLFAVKDPAMKLIDGIKGFTSGWKTLAFWLSLLGGALSLVGALKGFIPSEASLVATVVITAIYNFARGFEKMDQNAVRPLLQSTEFWMGVLGMASNALVSLQAGGINPQWMVLAQSTIATAMAGAQALGSQTPPPANPV